MEHIVHKYLDKHTVVTDGEYTYKGDDQWQPAFINEFLTHIFDCECEVHLKSWMAANGIRDSWFNPGLEGYTDSGSAKCLVFKDGTRISMNLIMDEKANEFRYKCNMYVSESEHVSDIAMAAVTYFGRNKPFDERKG